MDCIKIHLQKVYLIVPSKRKSPMRKRKAHIKSKI